MPYDPLRCPKKCTPKACGYNSLKGPIPKGPPGEPERIWNPAIHIAPEYRCALSRLSGRTLKRRPKRIASKRLEKAFSEPAGKRKRTDAPLRPEWPDFEGPPHRPRDVANRPKDYPEDMWFNDMAPPSRPFNEEAEKAESDAFMESLETEWNATEMAEILHEMLHSTEGLTGKDIPRLTSPEYIRGEMARIMSALEEHSTHRPKRDGWGELSEEKKARRAEAAAYDKRAAALFKAGADYEVLPMEQSGIVIIPPERK